MTLVLKHGSVWLANLNPRKGREPGKTRPVLIIQSQSLLNALHPTTLVIPLTTHLEENAEPLRIRLKASNLLEHDSDLLIDQLRSIDNSRFAKGPLMQCSSTVMKKVYAAIMDTMDIEPVYTWRG